MTHQRILCADIVVWLITPHPANMAIAAFLCLPGLSAFQNQEGRSLLDSIHTKCFVKTLSLRHPRWLLAALQHSSDNSCTVLMFLLLSLLGIWQTSFQKRPRTQPARHYRHRKWYGKPGSSRAAFSPNCGTGGIRRRSSRTLSGSYGGGGVVFSRLSRCRMSSR